VSGVVIVGAGQAGASAAIALRQSGFAGPITLLGAEPHLPYERPPLSKEYLAGERPPERLLLRPPAFWSERDIAIRTGAAVTAVDPQGQRVRTIDGAAHAYDWLIWAAGGHARPLPLPGADLGGVHVIRTIADVDAIRARLPQARRVVIAGGGYVGLEAAAVLVKLGLCVTLVEMQPLLLARVAGPEVAAFYLSEHLAHGVDVRLGTRLAGLEGDADGNICAVLLADGERLAADLVIAGIGLVPEVGALQAAGADCPDGVRVDGWCRTSLPQVLAIGDCALHPNSFAGGAFVRLESVQNAADMAKTAAGYIARGEAAPTYGAVPWFWSNQYDLRLQTVGLSAGADARIMRGDPATRAWSLVYLRAGAVVALDCINSPRDYVQGRALVERGARAQPTMLADASVPLKTLETKA
jgi:3-phenylpropionate/trans-cinnamate dioxygenase ferredoxin reductase subunit